MDKLLSKKEGKKEARSKKLLTKAFFELIEERPGENITVTEICERADYSRPTFYVYFNRIQDLVYYYYNKKYLEGLPEHYKSIKEKDLDIAESLEKGAEHFFDSWYSEVHRYRLLQSLELDVVLLKIMEETIKIFTRIFYSNPERIITSLEGECSIKAGAQTIKTIYDYWIKTGRTWDSKKMSSIYKSFINSVLSEFTKLSK